MTEKKHYEVPQMKVHQVKPAAILAGSPTTTSAKNEEYEEVTTETTNGWFQ